MQDHPFRIEAATRYVGSELALLRYSGSPAGAKFFGTIGALDPHNASREALAGMVNRLESYGPDKALPDGFAPLGKLTPRDVVFTHIDALWFDASKETGQ
ncbi:MAG: hypothetical protein WAT93_14095 [Pontixanthobacter sp.]